MRILGVRLGRLLNQDALSPDALNKEEWESITIYGNLDPKTIEKYYNYLNLNFLVQNQQLQKEFILEHSKELNWYHISRYQDCIDEQFIRDNPDKVNWGAISRYRNLSEEFLEEFKHKIHWFYITKNRYPDLSFEFKRKNRIRLLSNNTWTDI